MQLFTVGYDRLTPICFSHQVPINDTNTLFVEQTIAIMKNLLDSHTEGSSEHLGQASIETMMLNLVRSDLLKNFMLMLNISYSNQTVIIITLLLHYNNIILILFSDM